MDSMDFFSVDSFDVFDTTHSLVGAGPMESSHSPDDHSATLDTTTLYNTTNLTESVFLSGTTPYPNTLPRLAKVSLKCASEKENCYTGEFPQYLFKKPHKYDLKLLGKINHKELSLNLCFTGEEKPFQSDVSKVIPSELCIVDDSECILRFCLLVCSRTVGGKSFQLVATCQGHEVFRSTSFKCLARKRARHVKNGSAIKTTRSKKVEGTKKSNKRKAPESDSSSQLQVTSPLGSVSSPPSTPMAYPPLKKPKLEDSGSTSAPQITWDLFQLICGLDTSKIAQGGGNSRVDLAINMLNGMSADERNTVFRAFMQ